MTSVADLLNPAARQRLLERERELRELDRLVRSRARTGQPTRRQH
jgi:hypothetical protein